MSLPNKDNIPSAALGLPPGSNKYRNQELVLYGSIKESFKDHLLQRLRGLCDPHEVKFSEHEMVFTLKAGDAPVQVRMRRRMYHDSHSWHCKYIGSQEPDPKCPVIVRKCVDSFISSHNMMDFLKALGLRMDYEYLTDGVLFTWGNIKVYVTRITYTNTTGKYEQENRFRLSEDALFVEASTTLPEQADYNQAAKQLRDFADQLEPLCKMQKMDY
ncbi:unnamed protein product [Bursaphelenchus okinawaensis]|uniref:Mediator of RNA polymerase II transcription subunit 18 n=1 Tax=Bursaphelenchus okinawaensis TaxID=465554 RepID=A0A811KNP3_9BILA|nr:unnamed protein product [Bursaphelenchus okinawaensis]CAG9106853.1 unnamed protein product [Bursaphelenchus okinawaensis]